MITEELGMKLEKVEADMFGSAKKVSVKSSLFDYCQSDICPSINIL